MSCKRISPGQVVNGTRGAGKRRCCFITIEPNASKIEDIQDFDLNILRDSLGAADKVKCLCNRVGGGFVARSNRCVHNGYQGFLCR